jgi:feruloyl esterase
MGRQRVPGRTGYKAAKLSALLFVIALGRLPAAGATCESLASLSLPDTTITLAQSVPAGGYSPSRLSSLPAPVRARAFPSLPAFCRLGGDIKPTTDSDIKFEVWMPVSGWNAKFMGVGNGGWAGEIAYDGMSEPLAAGYATASTDTGHAGNNATFSLGHPKKVIDYGYRAVHETTVKAKAIIAAYYGQAPRRSYWNGCSFGGKQGLTEAQRFPADYDGVIAGAPANYLTHLAAHAVWVAQAAQKDGAQVLPSSKFTLIHNAVLAACDARDGVKDGVLENPSACDFDPRVLLCKGDDGPGCLTAPQLEVARRIYGPAMSTGAGRQIFPGLSPGSELGWAGMAGTRLLALRGAAFRYVLFQNPDWDYRTLNLDSDIDRADKLDHGTINAMDPDLKPFFARRGKILHYHGWGDQQVSPMNSVNYYTSVLEAMGGASKVQDSYRLFMVPGMGHCGGGEGTDDFNAIDALERWVEKGKAPEQMIAARIRAGEVERSRPLCPYPQVAMYRGSGSTDDAHNFVCQAH